MSGFDWQSIVRAVAPIIGTAIGGPLGGMAVQAIGNALGLDKPTEEAISATLQGASPDMLLKLKQADQAFAQQMKELDIKLEEINAGDRDSARKMQISTRSMTAPLLALFITAGFFGILIGMLNGTFHTKDSPELNILIGSLGTAWTLVIGFYFGSSAQSHMQTRLLGDKK